MPLLAIGPPRRRGCTLPGGETSGHASSSGQGAQRAMLLPCEAATTMAQAMRPSQI
jgi:hypothetical protein